MLVSTYEVAADIFHNDSAAFEDFLAGRVNICDLAKLREMARHDGDTMLDFAIDNFARANA